MDFSLSTLGCALPQGAAFTSILGVGYGKRRQLALHDTIPKQQTGKDTYFSSGMISYLQECWMFRSRSIIVNPKTLSQILVESFGDSDDDTASTISCGTSTEVSLDDDEDDDLFLPKRSKSYKKVSFAPTLVTQVYTRPTTTQVDKYYMHYSDVDYLDFKIAFVTGKDRTRKVSFARDVVSQVKSIPSLTKETKELLYYSEEELQRYVG